MKLWILFIFMFLFNYSIAQHTSTKTVRNRNGQSGISIPDSVLVKQLIKSVISTLKRPENTISDPETSLKYGLQAVIVSDRLPDFLPKIITREILSELFRRKGDIPSAEKYHSAALALINARQKLVEQADTYRKLGEHMYLMGSTSKEEQFLGRSLTLYEQSAKTSSEIIEVLIDLSGVHFRTGKSNLALADLERAVKLYPLVGYKKPEKIYMYLAGMYGAAGNVRKALDANISTLHYAGIAKDSATMFNAYISLAILNQQMNKRREQIANLEKARSLATKLKDAAMMNYIYAALGEAFAAVHEYKRAITMLRLGLAKGPANLHDIEYANMLVELVSIYTATGQLKEAQSIYPRILELIKNLPAKEYTGKHARLTLVNYFIASRQYALAEEQILQVQAHKSTYHQLEIDAETENYLYQLQSVKKNYEAANGHLLRYKELSDSISKRNHDRELTQLQVQYETEKKDQDIAAKAKNIGSLNRETRLQKKMLQTQVQARNLLIIAVVALILLLVISLSRQRIKRRANQELLKRQNAIDKQNESLQGLVNQREWLLKEVHHRVKNNLQIVISLLSSQAAYLSDPAMLKVLQESKHRMYSIALIHQKLYQEDNPSGVDMQSYIRELAIHLQTSFNTMGRIVFKVNIAEITLDATDAIPIGLILNEVITNSIKHAFTEDAGNFVTIDFHRIDDQVHLKIADNGKGFVKETNFQDQGTLGMEMIKGLSNQLGANLKFDGENGLSVVISWKPAKILTSLN